MPFSANHMIETFSDACCDIIMSTSSL